MRFAHIRRTGPTRTLLIGAAAAACITAWAAPALAQGRGGENRGGQPQGQRGQQWQGGGGMVGMGRFGRGMTEPTMTTRDLTRYADLLELSEDQREAARALLDAYQQDVQAGNQAMREQIEESRRQARGQEGGGGWQQMGEVMQKSRAQKAKLDADFLSDLKSLLEPAQETHWTRFERTHTREKGINRGIISGERMDVIKLVEDVQVSGEARQEIAPLLEQYEADLHREITNRDQVQEQLMGRMAEVRPGPDMDMGAMQRIIEEGRQASVRVRDLNRKYARQVQAALPEDKQFEFARAVKQASFPNVYREGYASRVLATADGLADLDAAQRDGIQALRQTFQREEAIVNDKLAAAQEETEVNFDVREAFSRGRDGGPLGELRRQKRELEETTVANLHKLLKPEQIDRLPQQEQDGGFVRGRAAPQEEGGRAQPRRRGGDGGRDDRP